MAMTVQEQQFIKMNKSIHVSNSALLSGCKQTQRFFPARMEALQSHDCCQKKLKHFSAKQVKCFFPHKYLLQPYSVFGLLDSGVIKSYLVNAYSVFQ